MQFRDVTLESVLRQTFGPRLKYGGAMAAYGDGDSRLDLLLTDHNVTIPELYFNNHTNSNVN